MLRITRDHLRPMQTQKQALILCLSAEGKMLSSSQGEAMLVSRIVRSTGLKDRHDGFGGKNTSLGFQE